MSKASRDKLKAALNQTLVDLLNEVANAKASIAQVETACPPAFGNLEKEFDPAAFKHFIEDENAATSIQGLNQGLLFEDAAAVP